MADKGTVGLRHKSHESIAGPRDRLRFGQLSLTGTAQLNEVSARTLVRVFSIRSMAPLMTVESAVSGTFAVRNLAAGRYVVVIDGQQTYLPGVYAVDVS